MLLHFLEPVSLLTNVVRIVARVDDLEDVGPIGVELPYGVFSLSEFIPIVDLAVLSLKALSEDVEKASDRLAEVKLEKLSGPPFELRLTLPHVFYQR